MIGMVTLALQDLKSLFDRNSLLHRKFIVDEIKKVTDTICSNLTNANSQFSDVKTQFNETQLKIAETAKNAKTDLTTVESQFNRKQTELETKITTNDKILRGIVAKMQDLNRENLQKLNADIQNHISSFNTFKGEYDKTTQLQADNHTILHKIVDTNRQVFDAEVIKINEQHQELAKTQNKHKAEMDAEFQKANQTITDNHNYVNNNYVSNLKMNENNQGIESKIVNANSKIDTNKTLISSHIEDTKNHFNTTNKALAAVKKQLDENIDNVKKMERNIDQNARSTIDKINTVYSDMETKNSSMAENLTKFTLQKISEANQTNTRYTDVKIQEYADNLKVKLTATDKTIDYLSLKANDTSILDGKISEFLRDINNRFVKVYETIEKAGEQEQIMNNVKQMIDASKFNPAPYDLDIKRCRDDIQGLQFTLTDIYNTSSKNITTMQGIQNQFDELNAKMIDLTNLITGLIRNDKPTKNIQSSVDDSLEIVDEL
jgi:hypothetical protein